MLTVWVPVFVKTVNQTGNSIKTIKSGADNGTPLFIFNGS